MRLSDMFLPRCSKLTWRCGTVAYLSQAPGVMVLWIPQTPQIPNDIYPDTALRTPEAPINPGLTRFCLKANWMDSKSLY
jgi:hypothetical protein